jgi:hypothetical protein
MRNKEHEYPYFIPDLVGDENLPFLTEFDVAD